MQHTNISDFAGNVSGTVGALPQVVSALLVMVGLILFISTIFWFKTEAESGRAVNFGQGVVRMIGAVALISMSSFVSTIGETVLTSEEFTLSSPGKILAEAAKGKESSVKDDDLQLISSEVAQDPVPASMDSKSCLTEGGFATYQGGKVEILLDQGNGWYRIKNQYGESSSKQKSDMECM